MVKTLPFLLSFFLCVLVGCGTGGVKSSALVSIAAVLPTGHADSDYLPVIGKVEVCAGENAVVPLENYLSSVEYHNGGKLYADGRSVFHNPRRTELMKIEREASVLRYSDETVINIKLSGGNGCLYSYSVYNMEYECIREHADLINTPELVLPDAGVCFVSVSVRWEAAQEHSDMADGMPFRESVAMEYVFMARHE